VGLLDRHAQGFQPQALDIADNGLEFVSRDLDLWACQRGVTLDFSRPGKPTDNAFAESFNGKVRAECLNTAWFMSLDDAHSKCETWRRDCNEHRPHSAIGDKCPIDLMNGAGRAIWPDLVQGWGQGHAREADSTIA
jgi:putative transposase